MLEKFVVLEKLDKMYKPKIKRREKLNDYCLVL
jgi:hypothetical protein